MKSWIWTASIALILYLGLENLVFRTGLYESLLSPHSTFAQIPLLLKYDESIQLQEAGRFSDVVFLGDSRVGGAVIPDRLNRELDHRVQANSADPRLVRFHNYTAVGSSAFEWFFLLRELLIRREKSGNPLGAVVLPVFDFEDFEIQGVECRVSVRHVGNLASLLDLVDILRQPLCQAGRAEITKMMFLRGYAVRDDVADFLVDPLHRFRLIKKHLQEIHSLRGNAPRPTLNLVGLAYDERSDTLTLPPHLDEDAARKIRSALLRPSNPGFYKESFYYWMGRITVLFNKSGTKIYFLKITRRPLPFFPPPELNPQSLVRTLVAQGKASLIGEHITENLEAPFYYHDGLHLNEVGGQEYTKRLILELNRYFVLDNSSGPQALPPAEGQSAF